MAAAAKELSSTESICASLTGMIALWRTLAAGETREFVVELTLNNLRSLGTPAPLLALLEQAKKGQGAFIQVAKI